MAGTNLQKNREGYGYKYTDLAQIHVYLEENNMKYYQFVKRIETDDYIFTRRYIDGKWEDEALQGCRVVNATLNGKSNPAQEQGSALTYARRYSLLMAFGLATEDDDAQILTRNEKEKEKEEEKEKLKTRKVTETEAKSIYALMTNKGFNVSETLQKAFGISNTKDLNKEQYIQIINKINSLK